MNPILWTPSEQSIKNANVTDLIKHLNDTSVSNFSDLYDWSIDHPEAFWNAIWDHSKIIGDKGAAPYLNHDGHMMDAKWFPNARLNFAENLLRRTDDADAVIFWGEEKVKQTLSFRELYNKVSQLAQALSAMGIVKGDRVAGFVSNTPETLIAMLATASLGAIWSSCSPDFGTKAALDRFKQIDPKVLFSTDGYYYNGKSFSSLEKLKEIESELPSLQAAIIIPYINADIPDNQNFNLLLDNFEPTTIAFERVAFDHPLYIMFSSGTTGAPKCIVHSVGGTLIQHLKEHLYHGDVKPDDRVFYFTTTGWMMWNWQVSALAAGAALMLYDGSPGVRKGRILFDYAEAENCTLFGTSAKFIDFLNNRKLDFTSTHPLKSLRLITSTGSPLSPEAFDYVYSHIKKDVCLASISGGTDIVSCFVLGSSVLPVYRGEIQTRGLGLAVDIFDEHKNSIREQKGELVCTLPFPAMPIGFWNDPDRAKYKSAYFEKFDNIWCHGDFAELTKTNGIIIHGRSDTVLNPGGIRIGTAEIYRPVEQLEEVVESIVVGQDWDNDVRVVLFVKLQDNLQLTPELISKIKQRIKSSASPRHVPAKVIQVHDIPRTKSGKIAETAVREIIHGRAIGNQSALANPEALDEYMAREELSA